MKKTRILMYMCAALAFAGCSALGKGNAANLQEEKIVASESMFDLYRVGFDSEELSETESHVRELKNGVVRQKWSDNGYTYEGYRHNNKPYGKARITTPNGDVFEGFTENGEWQCGSLIYADGSVYEGSFENEEKNGFGEYLDTSGNVYKGVFIDGKLNGLGKIMQNDGTVWCGMLKDGQKNGEGINITDNQVYLGNWENNEQIGKLKKCKKDAPEVKVYMECATPQEWDSYTGYKTEGEPFGVCTFTGEAGDVYKGEFLNGKYDGLGNYTVDNYEMTGCYRNGDSHGAFEIEYSDNSIYEGGMYNKYEGFGVMKYPQTSEFEYFYGMWHDGKKEGEGVLICRNGDIYEGSWKDDKRDGEFAVYQAGSEEGRKVTFKNDELAE